MDDRGRDDSVIHAKKPIHQEAKVRDELVAALDSWRLRVLA